MSSTFSSEIIRKQAQAYANEYELPMVVYQDFRGGFQITELDQYRIQIAVFAPQPANSLSTARASTQAEYFLCGFSENSGNTFIGKPKILTAAELAAERREISLSSGKKPDVIVITEIEINSRE